MHDDERRIIDAHAAYQRAERERNAAITDALRNRTVKQVRIAEIIGKSREWLRDLRQEAGIPPNESYVRKVSGKDSSQ